ncbi:MAG TPA: diaminopimelate epimerase, partial [Thermoanaerobaculia bacterium]
EDRRRIALLSRRGLSVGADGALFLSQGEGSRVHLDYFNADGGLASFCANGTRCAARYAVTRGLVDGRDPVLETGWGLIRARVDDSSVTLRLPGLALPGAPVGIAGERLPSEAIPINVGVPHLVVFVNGDLSELPIARLAPPLRRHPAMPDGANVNFVEVTGPSNMRVRTYERGVEGETLACGSGVVASAIVAARRGLVSAPVVCATRSGAAFTVDFSERDDEIVDARLTGDAREIYSAELTADAWKE